MLKNRNMRSNEFWIFIINEIIWNISYNEKIMMIWIENRDIMWMKQMMSKTNFIMLIQKNQILK